MSKESAASVFRVLRDHHTAIAKPLLEGHSILMKVGDVIDVRMARHLPGEEVFTFHGFDDHGREAVSVIHYTQLAAIFSQIPNDKPRGKIGFHCGDSK